MAITPSRVVRVDGRELSRRPTAIQFAPHCLSRRLPLNQPGSRATASHIQASVPTKKSILLSPTNPSHVGSQTSRTDEQCHQLPSHERRFDASLAIDTCQEKWDSPHHPTNQDKLSHLTVYESIEKCLCTFRLGSCQDASTATVRQSTRQTRSGSEKWRDFAIASCEESG